MTWLLSFKNLDGQLARWIGKLDQYDFKILHRKGISHSNADGLSRRPCDHSSCRYCFNVESKYEISNLVRRIIFEEISESVWRNRQHQDNDIQAILKSK